MKLIRHAFRLYLDHARFDEAVAFYEKMQGMACGRRITFPDSGIKVAIVGAFVLLGGSESALKPIRSATALLVVDDLDGALKQVLGLGAKLLHPPQIAPGGRNATVCHSDGLIAEYFQTMED